jgi:hypothetical protein
MKDRCLRKVSPSASDIDKVLWLSITVTILISLLSGCAHSPKLVQPTPVLVDRPVFSSCLSRHDADKLKAARPGKVGAELNGAAIHDALLLGAKNLRFEAWSDQVIAVLDGCAASR